ncbi:MAG: leucine-rich repeat domain-containing protein [Clostridiales bacterium]|nr:leucine-rich repeat domain-containing protein [Clostridiales bacterium]
MKRSKIIKILLCVVIATIGLMLGACSHDTNCERLATPQNLRVEDGALVWDEVKHAETYAVYVDDEEHTVDEARFSLSKLTEKNKEYELSVIAIGDGERYSDSDAAEYNYTYVVPTPNLSYTLLDDGSGYEVSRGNANLIGRIVIPDYYNGLPVKKIAKNGFWKEGMVTIPQIEPVENVLTTGVRLPNTLEEIGAEAFTCCSALTEVQIPDSVVSIGEKAFYQCKKLKKVILSSSLRELSSEAFTRCVKLDSLTLPSGLTHIGENAFENCPITEITIPDGVTRLESGIFQNCLSLVRINFPKNIEFFGRSVVRGTKWLQNQPDGIVMVQGYICGFNGSVPNGSTLAIPNEAKHVSGDVFRDLRAEDITLTVPDGITLGEGAFAYFKGLKSIRLPADLKCIPNYAFQSCSALESISIPDGVTEIGDYAFVGCNALSSLELPPQLKKIGDNALGYNNLGVLRIPESVTELGRMSNSKTTQIIMSPTLAATVPQLPLNGKKSIYITCAPEENKYNYAELYKGQSISRITFYFYVQDKQNLPDDGGNYWHYADDGKTPVIWQVQSDE